MNIRDLKYLVALEKHKHFGKAAEACFVSQPTLSAQIKKLEDELGVTVFERTNKQVWLTEHGKALIEQAHVVLQEVNKLKTMADLLNDPLAGAYRIGIIPTLAPYLLPHVLLQIKKQLPKLELFIIEEKTNQLIKLIRSGDLDAIVIALPVPTEGLITEKLFDEPFYAAIPKEHVLSKRNQLKVSDLTDQTLLLLDEGHCLRDQALEICHSTHIQHKPGFKATSLETLWQMVAIGGGLTLLPGLSVALRKTIASHINIIPFEEPIPTRTIAMQWRKQSVRTECHDILSHLIQTEISAVLY